MQFTSRFTSPFYQAILLSLIMLGVMAGLDIGFPEGGVFWDQFFTERSTLDYFCETSTPKALFRHKVNTYSNIGYFLAGTWTLLRGLRDRKRGGQTYLRRHPEWSILFGLACYLVFAGSTLFHAGLTVWTEWADLAGVYAVALAIGFLNLHRLQGLWLRRHTASWPFIMLYFLTWIAACATIFSVKSWYLVLGAFAIIALGGAAILWATASGRAKWWFVASMGFTLIAVGFFAADINRIGCDPHFWIQQHSNWHLGAATAFILYYRFVRSSTATHAAL